MLVGATSLLHHLFIACDSKPRILKSPLVCAIIPLFPGYDIVQHSMIGSFDLAGGSSWTLQH